MCGEPRDGFGTPSVLRRIPRQRCRRRLGLQKSGGTSRRIFLFSGEPKNRGPPMLERLVGEGWRWWGFEPRECEQPVGRTVLPLPQSSFPRRGTEDEELNGGRPEHGPIPVARVAEDPGALLRSSCTPRRKQGTLAAVECTSSSIPGRKRFQRRRSLKNVPNMHRGPCQTKYCCGRFLQTSGPQCRTGR